MTHDEWVHWRALWLGTGVFLREPLALYRQHEANVAGAPRTLTVGRDNVIPFPNRRSHNGIGARLMRYLREHVSITL
jgi:hypothetical protein